jgi:spore coat protein U-like protein
MLFKKTLLAVAALAFVGVAAAASNPVTATFQVLFKVNKACTVSATNLDLGVQESTGAVITAAGQGSVTVNCSKKTAYSIGLLPTNTGATATGAGVMNATNLPVVYSPANADTVKYQLYQNSALTTVWGNTAGTNTLAGTGTGAVQAAVSVYGKVTSTATELLAVTPDNYVDTVTVSVVY